MQTSRTSKLHDRGDITMVILWGCLAITHRTLSAGENLTNSLELLDNDPLVIIIVLGNRSVELHHLINLAVFILSQVVAPILPSWINAVCSSCEWKHKALHVLWRPSGNFNIFLLYLCCGYVIQHLPIPLCVHT